MTTLRERKLEKENARLRAQLKTQTRNTRQANIIVAEAQTALDASADLMEGGTPAIGSEDAWTSQVTTNRTVAQKRTSI